jgi:hypothetical protein
LEHENRRARVELRELYGKVPDDHVEPLVDRLRCVLFTAAAGNSLRRNFTPFRVSVTGDELGDAVPLGPAVTGNPLAALINLADPNADEAIAVVPIRLDRVLTRRAVMMFFESHDGTALEIVVPFYVRPPRTTTYSPARVRLCPPRVWPGATPIVRGRFGSLAQPTAQQLTWPGWLKRR